MASSTTSTLPPNVQATLVGNNTPPLTSTNPVLLENKYNISHLTFPKDLFDPNILDHNYVIFYINVPTESKMFKPDSNSSDITINDVAPRELGEVRGKDVSSGLQLSTIATGALGGGALGSIIGSFTSKLPNTILQIPGIAEVAGGLAGKVLFDTLGNRSAGFTRNTKRLKAAIALHIPNNVQISYGMNYDTPEMGLFGAAAEIASTNPEISGKLQASLKSFGLDMAENKEAAKNLFQAGEALASDLANGGPLTQAVGGLTASVLAKNSAALSFFSGRAANPRREVLFQSVNFRRFSMDYQFVPRDINEANDILNIIYTFKYHMHPEFYDPSNFLYVFPSEFDIVYYRGQQQNPAFHRHTSCVLTDMNVNYTPNGLLSLLPNGQPGQINVTLQFMELALLTKQKINALENPDLSQRTQNVGYNDKNSPF